jgi:hypothetical protein
VADEVDRRRAGEIEILLAAVIPDVDAFAADCCGEVFAKRAPKNR